MKVPPLEDGQVGLHIGWLVFYIGSFLGNVNLRLETTVAERKLDQILDQSRNQFLPRV
jgi:hypothetical protein